jgi:hypothetical protein
MGKGLSEISQNMGKVQYSWDSPTGSLLSTT